MKNIKDYTLHRRILLERQVFSQDQQTGAKFKQTTKQSFFITKQWWTRKKLKKHK